MKKITIKDLAEMMNMSVSTVSRALSDHPDISDETKEKVREVSKLYNYTPNLRARYLRTKSSGLIALILPEYNMFFIPLLMKSISKVAAVYNYSLLVFQSDDSYQKELDILDYCKQIDVDGILISLGIGFKNDEDLSKLENNDIPLVMIDKVWDNDFYCSVGIDDSLISENVVGYLHQKGHKSILGIFASDDDLNAVNRKAGFKKACKLKNIEHHCTEVKNLDSLESDLISQLSDNPSITAVFTMTDELLLRCHSFLQKNDFSVPERVSLISISDGSLPPFLHPPITYFYHSPSKIGEVAAEKLMKMIKKQDTKIEAVQIDCSLIDLGSVKDFS